MKASQQIWMKFLMLLIAMEYVILRHDALDPTFARAIHNWQHRPTRKMMQGAVEGHIWKEYGCAFGGEHPL